MRIAIVTGAWRPSGDGIVARLVATVTALIAQGHEVLVIGGGGDAVLPRVGRTLREFVPDVVHVVDPVSRGIAVVFAARMNGFPLVTSWHTDTARRSRFDWLARPRRVLLRLLQDRAAVNLADSPAEVPEPRQRRFAAAGRAEARGTITRRIPAEDTDGLLEVYQEAIRRTQTRPGPGLLGQFLMFLAVGGMNAVVDVAVFNVLLTTAPTRDALTLALYNSVAVCAAVTNSYWFNSRWTFRRSRTDATAGRWRRRSLFAVQAVLNIAVNDTLVVLLVDAFHGAGGLPVWVTNNVAKLLAMAAASLSTFVVLRRWVFAERVTPR